MKKEYRKAEAINASANIIQKIIGRINSYLSWWIANLGVVPLFLFAAFLFAPAFFSLFTLLIVVTAVLETILSLLYLSQIMFNSYNSLKYLLIKGHNVKRLLIFALFFPLLGHSNPQFEQTKQKMIMPIGQHQEIQISPSEKFTITNKEIISHRTKKGKLLLRAKKLGFSQLVIWGKSEKRTFDIYIINRQDRLKKEEILESLKKWNIKSEVRGGITVLTGEIHDIDALRAVQLILKDQTLLKAVVNINLGLALKNELREIIYKEFLDIGIETIHCKFSSIIPDCKYDSSNQSIDKIVRPILDIVQVNFSPTTRRRENHNYSLKLKIIQVEKTDGLELNFGLDQLTGGISSLLSGGVQTLIEQNKILLRENHIVINTLAEPIMQLSLDNKATVEIGGEYAYKSVNEVTGRQNTNWKFAGLKVEATLKRIDEIFVVDYKTRFTAPGPNNSIIGNKENGSISIGKNIGHQLFKVTIKSHAKERGNIPYLGAIPFIGRIFSSSNESTNYKQIIGVMELQQNE